MSVIKTKASLFRSKDTVRIKIIVVNWSVGVVKKKRWRLQEAQIKFLKAVTRRNIRMHQEKRQEGLVSQWCRKGSIKHFYNAKIQNNKNMWRQHICKMDGNRIPKAAFCEGQKSRKRRQEWMSAQGFSLHREEEKDQNCFSDIKAVCKFGYCYQWIATVLQKNFVFVLMCPLTCVSC